MGDIFYVHCIKCSTRFNKRKPSVLYFSTARTFREHKRLASITRVLHGEPHTKPLAVLSLNNRLYMSWDMIISLLRRVILTIGRLLMGRKVFFLTHGRQLIRFWSKCTQTRQNCLIYTKTIVLYQFKISFIVASMLYSTFKEHDITLEGIW